MKINIGELQGQDLLSKVDVSTGAKVMGGNFFGEIDAEGMISAFSNNIFAGAGARVISFSSSSTLGDIQLQVETGDDFSFSSSFSFTSSS